MFSRLLHSIRQIRSAKRQAQLECIEKEREMAIELLKFIYTMDYSKYRSEGGMTIIYELIDADIGKGLELALQYKKYKQLMLLETKEGETPWRYALRQNSLTCLQFYINKFDHENSPLFADKIIYFIINNDEPKLQSALSSLNEIPKDKLGKDYLVYAVWLKRTNLVRLMLMHKNHDQFDLVTALEEGMFNANKEACEILLTELIARKNHVAIIKMCVSIVNHSQASQGMIEYLISYLHANNQLSPAIKAECCYPLLSCILINGQYKQAEEFNLVFDKAIFCVKANAELEKKLKASIRSLIFPSENEKLNYLYRSINLTIFLSKLASNEYFSYKNLYIDSLRAYVFF